MDILKQSESKPRKAGKGYRKDVYTLVEEDDGRTFIDIRVYDCTPEGGSGALFSRTRTRVTGDERISLLMIHSQQFAPLCRSIACGQ